jgi:hypothetical protein
MKDIAINTENIRQYKAMFWLSSQINNHWLPFLSEEEENANFSFMLKLLMISYPDD